MSLWDEAFRRRLLRQTLSNDEIAQAVEAAEAAERERVLHREALERIYRTGKGVHVEIAREELNRV